MVIDSLFAAIFNIHDLPGLDGRTYYHGFCIMYEFDIRHADMDPTRDVFMARVWNTNSIIVTMPGWPFSLLHDRDLIAKELPACVRDGLDDALHKYTEPDQIHMRESRTFLLQFEDHVELSVKEIFKPPNLCEDTLVPGKAQIAVPHSRYLNGVNTKHFILWCVARLDGDFAPNKRGAPSRQQALLLQSFGPPPTVPFTSPARTSNPSYPGTGLPPMFTTPGGPVPFSGFGGMNSHQGQNLYPGQNPGGMSADYIMAQVQERFTEMKKAQEQQLAQQQQQIAENQAQLQKQLLEAERAMQQQQQCEKDANERNMRRQLYYQKQQLERELQRQREELLAGGPVKNKGGLKQPPPGPDQTKSMYDYMNTIDPQKFHATYAQVPGVGGNTDTFFSPTNASFYTPSGATVVTQSENDAGHGVSSKFFGPSISIPPLPDGDFDENDENMSNVTGGSSY
jgi:hypothetical protein